VDAGFNGRLMSFFVSYEQEMLAGAALAQLEWRLDFIAAALLNFFCDFGSKPKSALALVTARPRRGCPFGRDVSQNSSPRLLNFGRDQSCTIADRNFLPVPKVIGSVPSYLSAAGPESRCDNPD